MSEMKHWQAIERRHLLHHRLFEVKEVIARSPYTGKDHPFIYLDSQDWVNIVPITPQGECVLVEQYRHGSAQLSLEIPGGLIDRGEHEAVAARRECLEESGYAVTELVSLGQLLPNPAIFNNRLHCFYATDAVFVGSDHVSATEHTRVVTVNKEQLKDMLYSGHINHALVCATLWRLLANWPLSD